MTFVVDPHAALDRVLSRTVTASTGVSTTYYVYGLGLIGEETNGAYAAYHFDSRGSTVALTDINANVTDSFSYGPYGELNNHTGSSTTPFQYNGQFGVQTDPNGLLYMRARYYDPAIRRFINQDALFGNLDPGISFNRFAYGNGDPIDGTDPLGQHVVYVNDSQVPSILGIPLGHAAELVGNDTDGWVLFAKLGTIDQTHPLAGPGENIAIPFQTYQDFLHDQDVSGRYDRAVYIPTTENQDIAIIQKACAMYDEDYDAGINNCQDLVNDSLAAGGIATIGLHSTPVPGLTLLSNVPNIAYGQLLNYGTAFNTRDGLPTSPPDVTNPPVNTNECSQ